MGRRAGSQGPTGGKQVLTCSPTTSPDLSLQAPRQKPFLSAQLVFDSRGQLSHEPCIENMIQILTAGLSSMKASALKVFWLGQGAGWRNSPQGIPCFYPLESEALSLVRTLIVCSFCPFFALWHEGNAVYRPEDLLGFPVY